MTSFSPASTPCVRYPEGVSRKRDRCLKRLDRRCRKTLLGEAQRGDAGGAWRCWSGGLCSDLRGRRRRSRGDMISSRVNSHEKRFQREREHTELAACVISKFSKPRPSSPMYQIAQSFIFTQEGGSMDLRAGLFSFSAAGLRAGRCIVAKDMGLEHFELKVPTISSNPARSAWHQCKTRVKTYRRDDRKLHPKPLLHLLHPPSTHPDSLRADFRQLPRRPASSSERRNVQVVRLS